MLRVTRRQRVGFVGGALLLAGLSALVLAPLGGPGWYFVAAASLAGGFLALQLPPATADSRSVAAAGIPAGPGDPGGMVVTPLFSLWEVPVAFVGEPVAVLSQLQAAGWKLGGHGVCGAIDHDAFVTLEAKAVTGKAAAVAANRAVEGAGAEVKHLGEAVRIG